MIAYIVPIENVKKGDYCIPKENKVDRDVIHLIQSMLQVDVKKRITLEEIFLHKVCYAYFQNWNIQVFGAQIKLLNRIYIK